MLLQELQELCSFWQKKLRLQDWKIVVKIARHNQIDFESWARVEYCRSHKQATIYILDPTDDIYHRMVEEFPYDPEVSLVHELLHLHFESYDPPANSEEFMQLEIGLNLISEALVQLRKSNPVLDSAIKIKAHQKNEPP